MSILSNGYTVPLREALGIGTAASTVKVRAGEAALCVGFFFVLIVLLLELAGVNAHGEEKKLSGAGASARGGRDGEPPPREVGA
jgi:hypothetical protein